MRRERKKQRKIQIILNTSSGDVRTLSFSRRQILSLLTSCAFLFGLFCIGTYEFATRDTTHDSSLAHMQEHLLRRLGILSKLNEEQQTESVSALSKYEEELRLRLAAFETIMHDLSGAQSNPPATGNQDKTSVKQTTTKLDSEGGMGGGDEIIDPADDTSEILIDAFQPAAFKQRDQLELLSARSSKNLLDSVDETLDRLHSLPLGTPLPGTITSKFGWRRSPFSQRRHMHSGIDVPVTASSPILATGDGIVRIARYKGSYGKTVLIKHKGGLETLYGHLSRIDVKEGQKVCRGQQLGLVGSTGRSTGPHLHYEVRQGNRPIDPMPYIELASLLKIAQY